MEFSNRYIVFFAIVLCLVAALGVSSAAVALRPMQATNRQLFKQQNVLLASGVLAAGEVASPEEVEEAFANIKEVVIDRKTGELLDDDPTTVDPIRLAKQDESSVETPAQYSGTQVKRLSDKLLAYEINVPGHEGIVLPIHGDGLWSTLYGFLALTPDGMTVQGITFYEHKETPGLGGEVDNPSWKAQWPGKVALDENGVPQVEVVKSGMATSADTQVDGISGATITSRGVGMMVQLWLSEDGYGPYLATKR